MVPPGDHDCGWKEYALELQKQLADLADAQKKQLAEVAAQQREHQEQLEALKKKLFGKKTEKMPPMEREVRRERPTDAEQRLRTRRANAALRAKRLETEFVNVPVPAEHRHCPKCDGKDFSALRDNKPGSVIEYVPGYFRKRTYLREKLVCACGQYIVTAPVPDKVFERTQYGPGFMAHLVVCKCCDSLPFYRIEKQFKRLGVPMARSTMTALFHRVGELMGPIAARILAMIAASDVVLADETPERMQDGRKGYIWTFVAERLIAYRFSPDRSGQTPSQVLGGTPGTLVVDMYTGYNPVTKPGGRERAGCMAHARRKFFEALENEPAAAFALDIIRDIYVIEHDVREAGLHGSSEHARRRWEDTLPLMDKFYVWLAEQQHLHRPKSQMGIAIRYCMRNWQALTRYIKNVQIPPDNNRSESALRVVALGRKNFLFVGHEDAGDNLAALYTVVATCQANDVDPLAYLTDVLTRLDTTSANRLDELLPFNWQPASG
jgi:transposase